VAGKILLVHRAAHHAADRQVQDQVLRIAERPFVMVAVFRIGELQVVLVVDADDHVVRIPGQLVVMEGVADAFDPRRRRDLGVVRPVEGARVQAREHFALLHAAVFHDVDLALLRPARAGAEHPDRRPGAQAARQPGAHFDEAVSEFEFAARVQASRPRKKPKSSTGGLQAVNRPP
jgi:hypothetical protein